jgi:hypothetical protein
MFPFLQGAAVGSVTFPEPDTGATNETFHSEVLVLIWKPSGRNSEFPGLAVFPAWNTNPP